MMALETGAADNPRMLLTIAILLAASVLLVSLSRRMGLGSVLGYLVGGALIGPSGLRLVTNVDQIAAVSELGILMLLFLIGLEVRPQRLWVMRRAVFGLGTAQVAVTAAALAALGHGVGLSWTAALVLGAGLALSSTAIVLPMLAERDLLTNRSGRDTFSVLLLQDLAFIPLVAMVPLLASGDVPDRVPWQDVVQGAIAIATILVGGRYLIPPAFRAIGGARTQEVFTALALFVVAASGAIAQIAGLSASLGAFLGGVLLSSSEFRHEVQADVEPFEGLLLGFFFLSVGMSANLGLAFTDPGFFALAVPGLLLVKAVIAFVLGRIAGQTNRAAIRFALALPQGSEFSFVLFAAAVAVGALARRDADRATFTIALSMAATPVLFAAAERWLVPRLEQQAAPAYDTIRDHGTPVIIAGFGRVGQIVGRVLGMSGIAYTALEQNPEQVEVMRRFGNKVYFGNPACTAHHRHPRRRQAKPCRRRGRAPQLPGPAHSGARAQSSPRPPPDGLRHREPDTRDIPLKPQARRALTVSTRHCRRRGGADGLAVRHIRRTQTYREPRLLSG